ncbi:MAG: hypothetical protein WB392_06090 [Methanotrichaceae archaeon]
MAVERTLFYTRSTRKLVRISMLQPCIVAGIHVETYSQVAENGIVGITAIPSGCLVAKIPLSGSPVPRLYIRPTIKY